MINNILGPPVSTYKWATRSVYFGNKRWSRGVTKVIQGVFAPDFRFKKLPRGHCATGLPKRQAKRRGHAIDRTLDQWANGLSTSRSRLKEPIALIREFESYGWRPVRSQLTVAWPDARIGTRIDLVLYDATRHKIIVVEVKSGCGYRRKSHGMLRHLVPRVSNAPLHQHQLQVLLGKELLARTYPAWIRTEIECVLVYIASNGELELLREESFDVQYSTRVDTILLNTA